MSATELPFRIMAMVVIGSIAVSVIVSIALTHREDMERIKRDGGRRP